MNNDLLEQLAEYGSATLSEREPVTAMGVRERSDLIRLIEEPPIGATGPRWYVAVVAAGVVAVLIGGVALLARSTVGTSADESVRPTTIEEISPTTEADVATDTVAATTTIAAPIVPPGEGPKLSFVQAEVPANDRWNSGVWFKGDLYVLVSGEEWDGDGARELVRTSDGFTWEVIPGLPEATNVRNSMLQTDGNLLVNVVMPRDGNRGIGSDAFIQVNTSTNGTDWTSSRIALPVPSGSNFAGEFQLAQGFGIVYSDFEYSDNFAVGPKGIVVTATIDVSIEGEGFANTLVDPEEGIHVEVVDLDLDRGVMIVKFLNENNDMEQIGDLREIDLNAAGVTNLLDVMAADVDWEPLLPGLIAQLATEEGPDEADASLGFAWHSSDGGTWQRIDSTGPLAGGEFSGIAATPDGFVATASSTSRPSEMAPELRYLSESFDSSVVWESSDGMTWTEATGLTSGHGFDWSRLVAWQGELVEHSGVDMIDSLNEDTEVWTLASPHRRVFSDVPTRGLALDISDFGLIGTPTHAGSWGGGPDATEILFSVDGTSWNRWEPTEFDVGESDDGYFGEVWVVGAGDDFVVVQHGGWDESSGSYVRSLWVGVVP